MQELCRNRIHWDDLVVLSDPFGCTSAFEMCNCWCIHQQLHFSKAEVQPTNRIGGKQFMMKPCNLYTMLFWFVARLRVDDRKRVIRKVWNEVWVERSDVSLLEQRYTVNNLLKGNVIHLKDSFPQHQTCRLQHKTYVHPIQWFLWHSPEVN